MPTPRQHLITALEGGVPEQTPLSIDEWFFEAGRYPKDAWKPLLERGLGISNEAVTVRRIEHGVTNTSHTWLESGRRCVLHRKETPLGSLQQLTAYPLGVSAGILGWAMEEWIKTPHDYQICRWIIEHTELAPQYETFALAEARLGEQGITIVEGSRTPVMSICVDWTGAQRFCIDLADEVDELSDLYQAMLNLFMEETRLIASGPGRFMRWLENLTISTLGPTRYEQLMLPVYQSAIPILEGSGKRVMVHYDGALNAIRSQIARAPFHIIESLTEPPEGDMAYDECRSAWPDKCFWGNINLDLYDLPPEQLAEMVAAKRERAGKRGLAFKISANVPANWRETVPAILDTLAAQE